VKGSGGEEADVIAGAIEGGGGNGAGLVGTDAQEPSQFAGSFISSWYRVRIGSSAARTASPVSTLRRPYCSYSSATACGVRPVTAALISNRFATPGFCSRS
jgi:hypothetical protein